MGQLPVELKIADISFGGATYPILYNRQIRIVVNRHSGLRFVDTLAHELGHALHYAFVSEPSFLLQANYSEAFDEGTGQVMALMLYRPEIARAWFGLTDTQAIDLRERYRLRSLMDMREHIAESLFELNAYDDPDQDLAELYNRLCSKYLGVDLQADPVWGFNPFFGSEPLYLHNYVVAEMFARQVHHALGQKFRDPWGEAIGQFLRREMFSKGARYDLEEITSQITGEPLTPRYLIESFRTKR